MIKGGAVYDGVPVGPGQAGGTVGQHTLIKQVFPEPLGDFFFPEVGPQCGLVRDDFNAPEKSLSADVCHVGVPGKLPFQGLSQKVSESIGPLDKLFPFQNVDDRFSCRRRDIMVRKRSSMDKLSAALADGVEMFPLKPPRRRGPRHPLPGLCPS